MKSINPYRLLRISIFALMVLLFGCTTNEPDDIVVPEEEIENNRPFEFEVSILETGFNYAVLNWGPVYDLDNDVLYHTVYLEDSVIAEGLLDDAILKIENLEPETEYNGKVVVTDLISDPLTEFYSFKTDKYVLRFDRVYTGENGNWATGYKIEMTEDGGYIIFGQSDLNSRDALFMLKTDSLGFEMWHKRFYSKTSFLDLEVYREGDHFIIAHGQSISKLSDTGELFWQYHSDNDFTLEYTGLSSTSTNEILITGKGSLNYKLVGTLSRIAVTGELIWEKYISHEEQTVVENIIKTVDDQFVIIGSSWYGYKDAELFISKIDENGDLIWLKRHGNGWYDFPKYILEIDEGDGFICAGDNWGERDVSSIRILFLDKNGDIQSEKYYKWASFKTQIRGLIPTTDGGFAFTGSAGYSPLRGHLVKLDSHGDLAWRIEYKPDYMDYQWSGFDLKQTHDNGFIFCGVKGFVWKGEGKEVGLWIKKTDDKGE